MSPSTQVSIDLMVSHDLHMIVCVLPICQFCPLAQLTEWPTMAVTRPKCACLLDIQIRLFLWSLSFSSDGIE